MKHMALLACLLVAALSALWTIPGFSQEVLYEEHFTDGQTQLEWHPTYGPEGFMTDTMQVRADSTTPEGDEWIGVVARSDSTPVGIAYAGEPTLSDYSMEAWVYAEVWDDPEGLRQGLVMRMIPLPGNWGLNSKFYSFVARFDASYQMLKLSYHEEMLPTVLRTWTGDELPGGVPTQSSWHRMKLKAVGDSIWAYWDGVMLDGCPIELTQNRNMGYFGFYTFRMWMSDDVEIRVDNIMVRRESPTGIEEITEVGELPKAISLHQNYPNPFNANTEIRYDLPADCWVKLEVYNVLGQKVTTLVDQHQKAGYYRVPWQAEVTSGVYFYRIHAGLAGRGGYTATRKMILLR